MEGVSDEYSDYQRDIENEAVETIDSRKAQKKKVQKLIFEDQVKEESGRNRSVQ